MNQREKIMAVAVAGIALVFTVGFGGRYFFTKPLHEIDLRTTAVKDKLAKIQEERRAYFAAEDRMKALARQTYAETVEQAAAVSGELLTRHIIGAGLSEADFTRLPVGPRKLRGANEIGWNVQGEGPLTNIINLLYILDTSPWLHRTENLTVSTGDRPGHVRLHFRYLTLVLEPALEVTHTNQTNSFKLDSPARRQLDGIVVRDLLRPYIKAPPPPPPPANPAPATTAKPAGPPGPENYRVVSLSEWEGQPEVHVRDLAAQKTTRYKLGDALAGGTMVMVDYRSLPDPRNALVKSTSRIILKVGQEYWAIERGNTFADKHKLADIDLPPQLARAGQP